MSKNSDFQIKSTSDGFASRSKDIFANIDSLAATKGQPSKSDDKNDSKDQRSKEDTPKQDRNEKHTRDFKGRESIYRSPNESGWPPSRSDSEFRRPPPRDWNDRKRPRGPKRVPDHVVNPKKYKKYDLSDVSKDQMSDRSNTRAAFDFLRELKDRKTPQDTTEDTEKVTEGKISFKKPPSSFKKSDKESTSSNVVRDGNKRVMPECVVGQKKASNVEKKADKKAKNKKSSSSSISLSHLDDKEDYQ